MAHIQDEKAEDIVVVGGGIGGLATAVGLRLNGHNVKVLEKAEEFGEVGAGLQLGPNATRILQSWGVMSEVEKVGFFPENLVMRDALSGEVVSRLNLSKDFKERFGAPYVVIHRTDLHKILLDKCTELGVALENNAEVNDLEYQGDRVRLHLGSGEEIVADVAIGADGLHSRLRQEFSDDQVVPSGYVAYRGTIPADRIEGEANLNDVVVWVGPGCHLVQYRLRQGTVLNIVAVFESQKFLRGEEEFGGVDELDNVFETCHPRVKESVEHIGRQKRWPLFDRQPISKWSNENVVLMGDAAHPMLQYLAQGCCQALEDAKTLEVLSQLNAKDTGGTEWSRVFNEYEQVRIPRTAEVQNKARAFGEICHARGIARDLRNELLDQKGADVIDYSTWIYRDHIPASTSRF